MTADAPSTPAAEIAINKALIRSLLRAQHPDLADLPLQIMEAGWDNVMVRLGNTLALRLPRRAVAEPLILNEQKWLPQLGPQLPLPIPAPVRIGKPQDNYPFHWSVLNWLSGQAADLAPPRADQATILAHFMKTLHNLALSNDAPQNPHRDCPLNTKQADIEKRMAILRRETDTITPQIETAWQAGLAAPIDLPKCFIAGDIHARNVLVDDGKISAFIDWGDMCAGDPATDLASIWALFETPSVRNEAILSYGMSEATLARARGWAVFYGVLLLETGRKDTPRHAAMGEATLRRITQDG